MDKVGASQTKQVLAESVTFQDHRILNGYNLAISHRQHRTPAKASSEGQEYLQALAGLLLRNLTESRTPHY